MKISMNKIYEAIEFATIAHHGQLRKYSGHPYIIHPLRVLRQTADFFDNQPNGSYINEKCVAVLHDVLEDTITTYSDLEENFNKEVARGVLWLTSYSKQISSNESRANRKKMDHDYLRNIPKNYKIIKMIDRLDNLMDMYDKNVSSTFLIEKYIPESFDLLEAVKDGNSEVAEELEKTIKFVQSYWTHKT